MKSLQPRQYVYVALLLLIVCSYVCIVVLWRHQRGEIRSLNAEISTLAANLSSSDASNYTAVTISPTESAVYLPLAKLKLPASALSEGLVYSYNGPHSVTGIKKIFPANLSISTHDLAANAASTTQQFDCSEVVYADFVTPSYPVNPAWKSDGSTMLADGRTMDVYYAPSISGCQNSWQQNGINTKAIADLLKQAASY
jgi:hypothetical protein